MNPSRVIKELTALEAFADQLKYKAARLRRSLESVNSPASLKESRFEHVDKRIDLKIARRYSKIRKP